MSTARRVDGALGPSALIALIETVGCERLGRRDLLCRAQSLRLGNLSRIDNSITLLIELGLFNEIDRMIAATPLARGTTNWSPIIRDAVLSRFCEMLGETHSVSAVQLSDDERGLRLDALQLPGRRLGYPLLLMQFGIAFRSDPLDRSWAVADDCAPHLHAVIRGLNQADGGSGTNLSWLAEAQARRLEAGRTAEFFALAYEKRRLEGHPYLSQVRLISEDDISAGFDLLSFEKLRSLRHDRMIEVKGHGADKSFHWSEGEIEAAKRLRDRYWLYLVDLREIGSANYHPEMIQDPWAYFVEQNPAGWIQEALSYQFTAPSNV
ncbi:MAG: DUF3883 domain-containing protein [Janthinobacterium lividum]